MKKVSIAVTSILVAGFLFGSGYWTGSYYSGKPSRTIKFGIQNDQNPSRIDYLHTYTDQENQVLIDNLLMIYLDKEQVKGVKVDQKHPDMYMKVESPRQSVSLISSRIWFTNDGALIGERTGEDWDQATYYKISNGDARYIKEKTDF